jgi:hypothetical protein
METTLQTRFDRFATIARLAFWRSVSAGIAAIMRAPPGLRIALTSLSLLVIGGVAYLIGRGAGNLLTTYLH